MRAARTREREARRNGVAPDGRGQTARQPPRFGVADGGTENPWQFAGRWKNTDRPAHCASVWGNGSSSSHPWIFSCS